jgi:uncharacterized protein with ParB-like and HNH nuclease domain
MGESILSLMAEIQEGTLVLPDIQRSFVWSKEQIYAFLDSLFRDYPVGGLLFWKAIGKDDSDETILYHPFVSAYAEGMKLPQQASLTPGQRKYLVLDGQQRLQSLYIALNGSYDGDILHVDLLSGTHAKDKEDGIRYFFRFLNSESLKKFAATNPERKMVPLSSFVHAQRDSIKAYWRETSERFGFEPESCVPPEKSVGA